MQAGKLKDRVSLQQPGEVQDALGQPIPGWPEVTKLWADIRYLSGTAAIKADAETSMSRVSIQIRKRAGVTQAMRIVDADGVIYQILDVLPDKQHRDRINLPCEVVHG